MPIRNREELLMALTEASEVEHGLACQYLFAIFSLKTTVAEGVTAAQLATINQWKAKLRRIAKEEMEHLATVTNLLSAVGGAPHFRRPNFPQQPGFYPPDTAFALEPFGAASLKRYINFERTEQAPEGPELAPAEVYYRHVGELYAEIRDAFKAPGADALFINVDAQDIEIMGGPVYPEKAIDGAGAVAAIESLMHEGEAYDPADPMNPCPAPPPGETAPWSHYCAFYTMQKELKALKAADPAFQPARNVLANPLTVKHRDSVGGNLITDPDSRAVVELFNGLYTAMILTFQQYFAFGGETTEQRYALNEALMDFMKVILFPLGGFITKLPAKNPADGTTAGPSFEFYGQYRLSATPKVAWTVILEKIDSELQNATALQARYAVLLPSDATLTGIVTTVTNVRKKLHDARPV